MPSQAYPDVGRHQDSPPDIAAPSSGRSNSYSDRATGGLVGVLADRVGRPVWSISNTGATLLAPDVTPHY